MAIGVINRFKMIQIQIEKYERELLKLLFMQYGVKITLVK